MKHLLTTIAAVVLVGCATIVTARTEDRLSSDHDAQKIMFDKYAATRGQN